jgi:hypothetical protein
MFPSVRDSLVFHHADGLKLSKFFVKLRRWEELPLGFECAPPEESTMRVTASTELPIMSTASLTVLRQYYIAVRECMSASDAFLVVGKVVTPERSFFLTLVPDKVSAGHGVQVLFLQSWKGITRADTTVYTNIQRKQFNVCGKNLAGGLKLHTLDDADFMLSVRTIHNRSKTRTLIWDGLVTGESQVMEQVKRPVGQLVELPSTTSAAMKIKVKDKVTLSMGSKGGKRHAQHRPFRVPNDLAALLAADFKESAAVLSDYHLHQQRANYFQRLLQPADIARALQYVRGVARGPPYFIMDESTLDDIVGAIASSFYEDIGWRMHAFPSEHLSSALSYLSADIDQVWFVRPAHVLVRAGVTDDSPFIFRWCST